MNLHTLPGQFLLEWGANTWRMKVETMRLGSYEVLEEIGSGGMASVYRARQASVDRDVAIKVLHKSVDGKDESILRFQREARLIARLEHPHILPVYDFDGSHNPPYIVMRYLSGGTLKEVISRGQLPFDEVGFLMRQLGAALDYAHRQGVIHRDIKPSNIMIDRDGNTFVTDFGIARMAGGTDSTITQAGALVGTPEYMSPEQLMGNDEIDHRTDIYALGVMLFQMLTGKLPFPAEPITALIFHHLQSPVPSASALNETLPTAIDEIIARAMAKDARQRYETAGELARDVVRALGQVAETPATLRQVALSATTSKTRTPTTDTAPTPTEQNKVVTVVHIDAVEYDEMLETARGAEAARKAVKALWDEAQRLVDAHGGKIIEQADRHLTALWGMTTSREDDTEQAVRAALHAQAYLRAQVVGLGEEGEPLPLSIGVNTGLALLSPGRSADSVTATGFGVTLAVRLAESASGDILISHDAYRHVRGVFDIYPGDPLKVRGRKDLLPTFRVTAVKERSLRMETPLIEGVETAMIGRHSELKQLQNAYLNAFEDEETQVITLTGAAGLGKSRLLYEFEQWAELREESYRIFRGRATASALQRPYALLRDMLSFRFMILDSDTPAVVRQKVETGVATLAQGDAEMAAFIGQLAGFDFSDSPHIKGILNDAQQIRRRAKQLFTRFIVRVCEQDPVVMLLDDLHYADDATLDLLNDLFVDQPALRLTVICLARPALLERRPTWGSGQSFHKHLTLLPLDKRESRDLAREILQKVADLPKTLRDLLVERAEGIPLFMEELVKMLIDDRVIVKASDDQWTVEAARLNTLRVPPTLLGLLQARIDTLLYPEKLVLQRASVIGRIFYDTAISTIDTLDEIHLDGIEDILATLVERQFISRRETSAFAGSIEYTFAQSMVRDALYDNLLRRQHHTYHRGAAQWLISASGARQDEYLALIAEHYERAEDSEQAADYFRLAGDKAHAISAYRTALALYERGVTLTVSKAQLLAKIGRTYTQIGQFDDAQAHLERALASNPSPRARAEALLGLVDVLTERGQFDRAKETVVLAQAAVDATADRALRARFLAASASLLLSLSQYEQAERALEEGLTLAHELELPDLILTSLNRLGVVYDLTDRAYQARSYYQECEAFARKIGDRYRVMVSLGNLGGMAFAEGNLPEAERLTQEAIDLTRELEVKTSEGLFGSNLGAFAMEQGKLEAGLRHVQQAAQLAQVNGFSSLMVICVVLYGDYLARSGSAERGLEVIGAALTHPSADFNAHFWADRILPRLQAALGDAGIEAGLKRGAELDFGGIFTALVTGELGRPTAATR